MNRELEFRAWDGEQMRFVSRLDFDNDAFDMVMRTPTQSAPKHWKLGKIKDNPLMQSTGLFDKNGVEIFEGDFLKNPEGRIGFVSYENGCFGLTIHKSDTSSHRLIFNLGFLENKEVVGNIFENPELL